MNNIRYHIGLNGILRTLYRRSLCESSESVCGRAFGCVLLVHQEICNRVRLVLFSLHFSDILSGDKS